MVIPSILLWDLLPLLWRYICVFINHSLLQFSFEIFLWAYNRDVWDAEWWNVPSILLWDLLSWAVRSRLASGWLRGLQFSFEIFDKGNIWWKNNARGGGVPSILLWDLPAWWGLGNTKDTLTTFNSPLRSSESCIVAFEPGSRCLQFSFEIFFQTDDPYPRAIYVAFNSPLRSSVEKRKGVDLSTLRQMAFNSPLRSSFTVGRKTVIGKVIDILQFSFEIFAQVHESRRRDW